MTLLADPQRCPSCRHALPSGAQVCRACDLDLRGPRGARLFAVLTEADELIAQMRAEAVGAAGGRALPPPAPRPAGTGTHPARPRAPRVPRVATVPAVLLGLGALCVLVAASLFLPFAWELLGVLGRTVVLITLTAAAAAAARAAARRGLRASTEALGLVSLGLLTFDVLGARTSGWLGEISDAGLAVVLGAVLVVAGTAAHLWLRATVVGAFRGGEVVAVVGGLTLALGLTTLDAGTLSQRLAVVVPLLGAVALATAALRAAGSRLDLTGAPAGHLAVAGGAWVALAASGLAALDDGPDGVSWVALWPGGAGLPLLLAGTYVALPALVGTLPAGLRRALLSVALLPWTVMATAPAYDEGTTPRTLVAVGVVLTCLLAAQLSAAAWRVTAPLCALAGLAATLLSAPLITAAATTTAATVTPAWGGSPGGRAVATTGDSWSAAGRSADLGSPWLLLVVPATLSLLVLVAARHADARTDGDGHDAPEAAGVAPVLPVVATAGCAVTVLGACGALLLEAAPVWSVVAVLLASGLALGLVAARGSRPELHVGELILGGAALLLSSHDEWLTIVASLTLLPLGVRHHARGTHPVRFGGGLAATGLLAVALWAGGALADVPATWGSLVVLLAVGSVAVARGALEARAAEGVDLGAGLVATTATCVAVATAPAPQTATWLAVMLTGAGAATTLLSLTRPERARLRWAGGLLLAAASWVRLADVGVTAPEAYTVPTALVLLVAGWRRTRTDRAVGTLAAWSPGLGLALVPSLLWALADPVSSRALLLGLVCFVLTVVGAQQRVAAPFAWGAAVGAVLVTWEVLPPALEMSAWLVTGAAGAALLVLGASWEQRVSDARSAVGYLRALR